MPINVSCPECDLHFLVGDEFAGRPGRCPECNAIIHVPGEHEVSVVPVETPDPFWAAQPVESIDDFPATSRRRDDERQPEREAHTRRRDESREPRFDPMARATKWQRVHRGLGYVQIAIVLGLVSQVLQSLLMIARGGERLDPNGPGDSGQIAMAVGALVMMLASAFFWFLGRLMTMGAPYVPARGPARASFLMVLGGIMAMFFSFCSMFVVAGAAPAAPGGPPPPAFVFAVLIFMGILCLTGAMIMGAEIAAMVSLARIGDALRSPGAAGWARRSIGMLVLCAGFTIFGLCGLVAYLEQQEQEKQKQRQNGVPAGVQQPDEKAKKNGQPAGAAVKEPKGPTAKAGEKAKDKDRPGEKGVEPAANGNAPPPGAVANGPDNPIDEKSALLFDLIFYGPTFLYLLHVSVALQLGRRAIRREINALMGRDRHDDYVHGDHRY
jgi:hypothetical protein